MFLPRLLQTLLTLCKVLHNFWINPIEKIFVIFELANILKHLLGHRLPVVMHLIGFPLCRILVTIWNKAAIVPILV